MPEVPRVQTPATVGEVRDALRDAGVSAVAAAVLVRHLQWEHGGALAAVQNWNFGNFTVRETADVQWYRPPWFEVSGGASARLVELHEAMVRGEAPSAFRARGGLEEGVREYVAGLRRSFPGLWRAAVLGDADGYALEVVRSGYAGRITLAEARAGLGLARVVVVRDGTGPLVAAVGVAAGVWWLFRRWKGM